MRKKSSTAASSTSRRRWPGAAPATTTLPGRRPETLWVWPMSPRTGRLSCCQASATERPARIAGTSLGEIHLQETVSSSLFFSLLLSSSLFFSLFSLFQAAKPGWMKKTSGLKIQLLLHIWKSETNTYNYLISHINLYLVLYDLLQSGRKLISWRNTLQTVTRTLALRRVGSCACLAPFSSACHMYRAGVSVNMFKGSARLAQQVVQQPRWVLAFISAWFYWRFSLLPQSFQQKKRHSADLPRLQRGENVGLIMPHRVLGNMTAYRKERKSATHWNQILSLSPPILLFDGEVGCHCGHCRKKKKKEVARVKLDSSAEVGGESNSELFRTHVKTAFSKSPQKKDIQPIVILMLNVPDLEMCQIYHGLYPVDPVVSSPARPSAPQKLFSGWRSLSITTDSLTRWRVGHCPI